MLKKWNLSLKNENTYLKLIMAAFVIYPLLFLLYLNIQAGLTHLTIKTMIQNNIHLSLYMINSFVSFYGGYIFYKNQTFLTTRFHFMTFILILLSQLVIMNLVIVLCMLIYCHIFIGLKNIKRHIKKCPKGHFNQFTGIALFMFLINLLTLIIRITKNA